MVNSDSNKSVTTIKSEMEFIKGLLGNYSLCSNKSVNMDDSKLRNLNIGIELETCYHKLETE